MRRRTVLRGVGTTALAVATAGCALERPGGNGLRLAPVERFASFAAVQPAAFSEAQTELVSTAHSEGAHTTYGHRPFPDGTYVEIDATFYRVTVTRSGTKQVVRTVLGADEVDAPAADAVAIDAYPDTDRDAVVIACRMAIARTRRTRTPDADPTRYVVVFRSRSPGDSALLPEPDHPLVTYDERTFRLWTDRRELQEDVFRSELTMVADDPAAFRRAVEEEFVIDLDAADLPPAQRAIIETAADEGEYTESGRISPEFDALIERLRDEAPRSESLIRYEGQHYTWDYWHSD